MRYVILASLMALAPPLSAQDAPWRVLRGEEVKDALSERTLKYTTATQKFYASGKTLYDSGRPSWGYWRVAGNQYCSQWPPSDLWACYELEQQGMRVRFVGQGGDITEGVFVDAE